MLIIPEAERFVFVKRIKNLEKDGVLVFGVERSFATKGERERSIDVNEWHVAVRGRNRVKYFLQKTDSP